MTGALLTLPLLPKGTWLRRMVSGQHPQQEPGVGGTKKSKCGSLPRSTESDLGGDQGAGRAGVSRFFLSLLASLLLPSSARGQLAL